MIKGRGPARNSSTGYRGSGGGWSGGSSGWGSGGSGYRGGGGGRGASSYHPRNGYGAPRMASPYNSYNRDTRDTRYHSSVNGPQTSATPTSSTSSYERNSAPFEQQTKTPPAGGGLKATPPVSPPLTVDASDDEQGEFNQDEFIDWMDTMWKRVNQRGTKIYQGLSSNQRQ